MPVYGATGTITEASWSWAHFFADGVGVADTAAWKVTSLTGRNVRVAPGQGSFPGVRWDAPESVVPIPTAATGRWFLIVASYSWSSGSAAFEAIPHNTTGSTAPVVTPAAQPTLTQVPGVAWSIPVAWVWFHPTDSAQYRIFDLRRLPDRIPVQAAANGGVWEKWNGTGESEKGNDAWQTCQEVSIPDAPAGTYQFIWNGSARIASVPTGSAMDVIGTMRFLVNDAAPTWVDGVTVRTIAEVPKDLLGVGLSPIDRTVTYRHGGGVLKVTVQAYFRVRSGGGGFWRLSNSGAGLQVVLGRAA